MRRRLITALTSLVVCTAVLAGCTEDQRIEVPKIDLSEVDLPEVDWKQYEPRVREEIEGLVENADCQGLRDQLDGADPDLRRYLDAAMDEAGC